MNTKTSFFRAFLAILAGALLVKFRDDAVVAITLILGGLFFISGLMSCVSAFVEQRHAVNGESNVYNNGLLWSVGMGSMIFGVVLVVMPKTFLIALMYILAGILVISAVGQYASLATATRYGRIRLSWWIAPSILLLVGILCIVNPHGMISAPLFIIGWALMVYGVVEMINALMIRRLFKRYAASLLVVEGVEETAETEDAEEAEAEMVEDNVATENIDNPEEGDDTMESATEEEVSEN